MSTAVRRQFLGGSLSRSRLTELPLLGGDLLSLLTFLVPGLITLIPLSAADSKFIFQRSPNRLSVVG